MTQQMKFTARDRLKLLFGLGLAGCTGRPDVAVLDTELPSLKEVFADEFLVGTAVKPPRVTTDPINRSLAVKHFSSFTAENAMKARWIAPERDTYRFEAPDSLVDFAEANSAVVRGHALVWYRSTPDYFTQGSPSKVRKTLEPYIDKVVSRYRGRIAAWDVVNEVISDAPDRIYRQDDWFAAAGPDYIDWAFNAAHRADPNAKLFINDYSTEVPSKRARLITVLRDLLDRGIPIDGVGHQFHLGINSQPSQIFAALDEIDALGAGLEQHVTELDISIYNDPVACFETAPACRPAYGPRAADVPEAVFRQQAQLYRNLFDGFRGRPSLTSVSFWGMRDDTSWLNVFPTERPNYPLLFDENGQPKSAFHAITDPRLSL